MTSGGAAEPHSSQIGSANVNIGQREAMAVASADDDADSQAAEATVNGRQQLSFTTKMAYGLGDSCASAVSTVTGFFDQIFFLNYACIDPAGVAGRLRTRFWIQGHHVRQSNALFGRHRN